MDPQTTPQSDPPQTQPMQTGKSKDPAKMWAMILVLLLLAAIGFGVWQTLQLNALNSQLSQRQEQFTELDNKASQLQAELDSLKGVDTSGTETDPDTIKVLAATDAYVRAPKSAANGTYNYSITKNDGSFAKVSIGVDEGSGFNVWLKKVDDTWIVVLSGQDTPTQEDLDKYGIPADF